MSHMRHAVIMAGGSGTRLWPLSRRLRPKQLMRLFDGASLLQLARRRLDGLFAPANIWVITSADYLDLVARELPDLPRENLIGEPMGRDTANAIGLAAYLLHERDPAATMAVFTADHMIGPPDRFSAAIERGLQAAEQSAGSLVTFGIPPISPHTGYGYVHRGEKVSEGTYRVVEFKEKPSRDVAFGYLKSGEYFWNSGMFAWTLSAITDELNRCLPENSKSLRDLAQRWSKISRTPEGAKLFESCRKISIDYGVMEKAKSVLVVQMDCDWLDLGSWTAIAQTGTEDAGGNVAVAQNALLNESQNNVIVTEDDHLIVTFGVNDVIVVHSPDATLICHRDHAERTREIIPLLQQRFGKKYE